ncbi:class I SAM-dependent methyltransferase [Vagococcus fessus]
MNIASNFAKMGKVHKLLYYTKERDERMPQNKIESGFNLLDNAIQLLQSSLTISFVDAYIENGENMNDDYQVRVEDNLPDDETKTKIESLYQEFKVLELEVEERRKVSQLLLLKGTMSEQLQPNHQLTPDTLGFLFVYLVEQLSPQKDKPLIINDLTVGMGNLLLTVMTNLQLAGYHTQGNGIDVDDTLLAVTAVTTEWLEQAVQLYHQDSMQHLLIEPGDVAIADLPIGYYPHDEQASKFVTSTEEGHSYAHHLLMEQSMNYVKEDGFGLFLVPSNFLETDQASELKTWLTEKVYLQGVLQLPESLFKNKQSRKSIIIIQNRGDVSKQAKEVLLADVPSLKDGQQVQQFFKEFSTWKNKNLI